MSWAREKMIRFLMWLLTKDSSVLDYDAARERDMRDWLFVASKHPGLRHYVHLKDLQMLKNLGNPQNDDQRRMIQGMRIMIRSLLNETEAEAKRRKEVEVKKERDKVEKERGLNVKST